MHIDLQNPLLLKYKFDAKEFVQGSSEAFKQVHRAIASLSFTNFVNGYVRTYHRVSLVILISFLFCTTLDLSSLVV